ncbi:unnamed protein product, partial [marine sediment metagenome]
QVKLVIQEFRHLISKSNLILGKAWNNYCNYN